MRVTGFLRRTLELPMKRFFKRCLYGLVASTVLTGSARAQEAPNAGSVRISDQPSAEAALAPAPTPDSYYTYGGPGTASVNGSAFSYTSVDAVFAPRYYVDARGGNLYGYDDGYTSIGAFVPQMSIDRNSVFFADFRAFATNQGRAGTSVGFGFREYMEDLDRLFGAAVSIDYDDGHSESFQQVVLSLESLGRYFDMRANGYLPVGPDTKLFGRRVLTNTATPFQNSILIDTVHYIESAYGGFDIEVGGPMPLLGRYGVNGYVGFYFFSNSTGGDFTGVSGRINAQINEDLSIGVQMTDDHEFGTNAQIQVAVTLPDGPPNRWLRNLSVRDRLTENLVRNYRVTVSQEGRVVKEGVSNPDTGNPYFVVYVDPDGPVGGVENGSGTWEDPYRLLASADAVAAADIVFVSPRTTGTGFENLDTGFTLNNNQRLWGTTTDHSLLTTYGLVNLPALESGALPIISNVTPGTSVITLANNNEVSGFEINGTNGGPTPDTPFNRGISGTGITGFNINNNYFVNTLVGVDITHTGSATGVLTNNVVIGAGGQSVGGFFVTHNGGTLDLTINNPGETDLNGNGIVDANEDRNGDGILNPGFANIQGEDANRNGVLDPTEDTNNNGILDPGEDTNGNGVLDFAEDQNGNGQIDGGTAIRVVGTGAGTVINARQPGGIFGNTITTSGQGIHVRAADSAVVNLDLVDNSVTLGNDPDGWGIRLEADDALLNLLSYIDNVTQNNQGDGGQFFATNGGEMQISSLSSTQFNNNGGNGLQINASYGSLIEVRDPVTGDLVPISQSEFNNNGENGLLVVSATGSTINMLIGNPDAGGVDNTFNNNGSSTDGGSGLLMMTRSEDLDADGVFDLPGEDLNGDGIFQTTSGIINTWIVNAQADNNGSGLTLTPGKPVMDGNSSIGSGFAFDLNGGEINLATFADNEANGNTLDGVSIVASNGSVLTTPTFARNNLSNNTRAGLFVGGFLGSPGATPDSIVNLNSIVDNNFDRTTSGTSGILFDGFEVVVNGRLARNSFVGTAPTAGPGIGGTLEDGGLFFDIGNQNPADTNTFTGNTDAHIGIILSGDSISRIRIENQDFSNAVNGSNLNFDGEGIAILLRDAAILDGYIRSSTFTNNQADGIRFEINGTRQTQFTSLRDFVIGGTPAQGNIISNNGQNGIQIDRFGTGQAGTNLNDADPNNDVFVRILNNEINENGQNGIFLSAAGAQTVDGYFIQGNQINTNGLNGIHMFVRGDANIDARIDRNEICFNNLSGIRTSELVNTGTDARGVGGIWTNNVIAQNGDDGIWLDAASNNLLIGTTVGTVGGNQILDNGLNGIQVTGPGSVTIGGNLIDGNGVNAGGIEIAGVNAGNHRPFLDLTLVNNDITNNLGDGVEFAIATNFFGFGSSLTMDNNNVAFNSGRGVDILNRTDNDIQVSMTNNLISNNFLEGVYIVNTSSDTQTNDNITARAAGGDPFALDNNGTIFRTPNIDIFFDNNEVTANGVGSAFDATGVVVRVGTSNASTSPFDNGGFASNRAGVRMTLTNSTILGNQGEDLSFESFVSTENPGTTAGTWNQNEFTITPPYNSDPLARLDLIFGNNTFGANFGDQVNGVNNGLGVGSNNIDRVAYYNNPEGVFKSRLNNIQPPNIPGPFTSATRRRNAQRQAARLPFLDAPNVPPGLNYLYPGTGASTFRVRGLNPGDLAPFLLDNVPYNDTGDANGFFLPNSITGELPYGWGQF